MTFFPFSENTAVPAMVSQSKARHNCQLTTNIAILYLSIKKLSPTKLSRILCTYVTAVLCKYTQGVNTSCMQLLLQDFTFIYSSLSRHSPKQHINDCCGTLQPVVALQPTCSTGQVTATTEFEL